MQVFAEVTGLTSCVLLKSAITGNKVLIFDKKAFYKKGPKLSIIFIICFMREGQMGRHTSLPRESKGSEEPGGTSKEQTPPGDGREESAC